MIQPARRLTALLPFALLAAASCGAGDDAQGPRVTRTTRGDTTVIRTESGSVWGATRSMAEEVSIGVLDGEDEYMLGRVGSLAVAPDGTIYVMDAQGPTLRAYDPDGHYLRTLGRPGEGPGELKQPDAGLAVLSDGRVVVRDPGNTRLQVYAPDGTALATWPLRGGFFTSTPLWQDRSDNVYTQVLLNQGADVGDWQMGLVRIGPDGVAGDTLGFPEAGFEPPFIEARSPDGGSTSRNGVPFAPDEEVTLSADGWFADGVSTDYTIRLLKPGAPLIVERVADPVPVAAGEADEARARATKNMRGTDPNWKWNGPDIPDHKPPFKRFYAARDGRIWVLVSQPGVEGEDPDYDPKDPDAVSHRWKEPVAFDVFEPDGTYVGQVRAPDGFAPFPTPVFDGDRVWAVVRDELDVQRVVRFRIVSSEPS